MFKLMGKEINAILDAQTILNWTHDVIMAKILCSVSKVAKELQCLNV